MMNIPRRLVMRTLVDSYAANGLVQGTPEVFVDVLHALNDHSSILTVEPIICDCAPDVSMKVTLAG